MIRATLKHFAFCLMAAFAFSAFAQAQHITVPPGNVAIFKLNGLDSNGNVRSVQNATATLDSTAYAYVAQDAPNGNIVFVSKGNTPPAGTTVTVSLTVASQDASGNPLPAFVVLFDIPGPPVPPPATHLAFAQGPFVRDTIGYTPPADPHAPTVNVVF